MAGIFSALAPSQEQRLRRRLRQQAVVARFGRRALAGISPEELMEEAPRLAKRALRASFVELVRVSEDGERLETVAGAGWRRRASGPVPAGEAGQIRATLTRGRAVRVADYTRQGRVERDERLRRHGVVSAVSVLIGPRDDPYGVLAAYDRRAHRFGRDDVAFLQALANILAEARRRHQAELASSQFRAIFDATPDLVGIGDRDQRVLYINPAGRRLLGIEGDPGRDRIGDAHTPASARLIADEAIPTALRDGYWEGESEFLDAAGNRVPCSQILLAHRDERGELAYLSTVARDISERRRHEREQAEQLARARSQQAALLRIATSPAMAEGDLEAAVPEISQAAAEALAVERVSVWQFDSDGRVLRSIGGYERSRGVMPPGEALEARRYPGYFGTLASGLAVEASDARHDRQTRELTDDYLIPLGITSLLDAAIRVQGRVTGVICIEHTGPPRQWTPDEASFATQLADQLSQLLLTGERRDAMEQLRRSESRYRTLFENAPEALVVLDADTGRFVDVNRNAPHLFGIERERLLQSGPADLSPARQPDGQPSHEAAREFLNATLAGQPQAFEWVHQDAAGRELICEIRLAPYPGEANLVHGSILDITERREAERALRASEERYRILYDHNPSMFVTADAEGTILSVNRFGAERLGYNVDQLVGTALASIYVDEGPDDLAARLRRCLDEPGTFHRWEARQATRDGSLMRVRVTARAVEDTEGRPVVLMVGEDFTETYRLAEELAYQARHDPLTGLHNRRKFESAVHDAIADSQRSGATHALCYLDLDQFKIVNDTCGHAAGDELLRQLARVLEVCVGERDVLARLGGDEFGVLLEGHDQDDAEPVAERIREAVETFHFIWNDTVYDVGVSIGVIPVSSETVSLADALSLADAACFTAKEAGRNRIHVYRPGDRALARHYGEMRWVGRVRNALEGDRFRLYCQTIAPLREDGGGERCELLVRMVGGDGAPLSPGAFLPAAERYNLATHIDRWVVREAFAWFAAHPRVLERFEQFSINLSGKSLSETSFLEELLARLDRMEIPPERVCFEITETAAIGGLHHAAGFINALRGRGCSFALDDFGSGMASFAYLRALPVDFVKIDGVFVRDIAVDPVDLALVRSINEIGQVMGKKTIGEFAESEAVLARLRELGVDYAQGFGVGYPHPLEDLA